MKTKSRIPREKVLTKTIYRDKGGAFRKKKGGNEILQEVPRGKKKLFGLVDRISRKVVRKGKSIDGREPSCDQIHTGLPRVAGCRGGGDKKEGTQ